MGKINREPDESSVLALSSGFSSGGEEQLRPVQDVDEDRELGLYERLQVVLKDRDNVLKALNDGPVHTHVKLQ